MRIIKLLILALTLVGTLAQAQSDGNSTYKLASGDVIRISVFGEPDLSFDKIRLTDAGSFSYPFIGEINVKGRTAAEIEKVLTERLTGDYLVDPRVSVSVLEYREFFISGEVKEPGGYPFQPGLTVRRAIALAGGLTERASTSKMTVVRDQDASRQPQGATLDMPVMPGDSINIEQSFF